MYKVLKEFNFLGRQYQTGDEIESPTQRMIEQALVQKVVTDEVDVVADVVTDEVDVDAPRKTKKVKK